MDHAERLTRAAREVAAHRKLIAQDADLRRWTVALKAWQSQRLAATHRDLLTTPRYRDAAKFFLDDLYGTKDFSQRDAELARMIPKLTMMLPDQALATLADAVELDAMSERLDEAIAEVLRKDDPSAIGEAAYADAYRDTAMPEERLHQLDLVLAIGRSLDRLVKHPLIGAMLAMMSGPARLAGLATMHQFLLDGFNAFKGIGGASDFLGRIDVRERRILHRLFDGQRTGWTIVRDNG
jgi:hypothetical protein